MIGVDYDLFWTLNPKTMQPFIKAFKLSQENKNAEAWLNGVYIRLAIASVFGKNSPYPKQPIKDFKEKSVSPEEGKARMFKIMEVINSRFGKGEKHG
jgi:hypothetical protein